MPREFGRAKPDEVPQLIAADDGYRVGWAGLGPVSTQTPSVTRLEIAGYRTKWLSRHRH